MILHIPLVLVNAVGLAIVGVLFRPNPKMFTGYALKERKVSVPCGPPQFTKTPDPAIEPFTLKVPICTTVSPV